MTSPHPAPYIGAQELDTVLTWSDAVSALRAVLARDGATATSPLRSSLKTRGGELLIMPAELGERAGVKVLSVSENCAPGTPRIQGHYLLFDGQTLSPLAIIDGVALTAVRTAALSALAVDLLAEPTAHRLVVFGSGPQAVSHVRAISAVRAVGPVRLVGRDVVRAGDAVASLRGEGFDVQLGSPRDVATADIVACCTTASTPLFDSADLTSWATVVAVGSHSPNRREIDARLVREALVVVESMTSAMAEAGDILLAIDEGVDADRAIDGILRDVVLGELRVDPARPRLFKSVGEGWADLAVAECAFELSHAAAGLGSSAREEM
jgi:ornithine cyclodeaminase/alanine dehydrogenase-like protein (mu-crystallin family)